MSVSDLGDMKAFKYQTKCMAHRHQTSLATSEIQHYTGKRRIRSCGLCVLQHMVPSTEEHHAMCSSLAWCLRARADDLI
eukprot:555091-Amphidinium_carterae.1